MVYMDPKSFRARDLFVDLESGTNSSNLEAPRDDVSGVGEAKNLLSKVWSGFVSSDGLIKGEDGGNSGEPFSTDLIEGLVQSGEGREEKVGVGVERKNKKGIKQSPKPPRPPKSPSLDAADQKFIREISELAMLKRARMERMKMLKKVKNTKATSSNSSMYALAITIIFCIVIIWQGVFSRDSSSLTSQRSPASSSVGSRAGLISVQLYRSISTDGPRSSITASPNNVEQESGLDDHGESIMAG